MIVPTARWLWGATALAFLALLGTLGVSWMWPWLGATGLWVVAWVIDAWRMAGLEAGAVTVTHEAPPAFSCGRSFPVTWRWRNASTRDLHVRVREAVPAALGDPWQGERSFRLGAGTVFREHAVVRPVHRGRARVGRAWLRVASPWRLAEKQVVLERPWDVTIYPSLVDVVTRALPTQAQRRREVGLRQVRRLGEGRTFESLRDWVPGDDTRIIDWKATARRGKPMARQYEDERRQQVLIVIDAGRMLTAEVEGRPRLEAVVDAALQLAHAAIAQDDNVGLMVFADDVQHWIPPARGRRALRQVLDALAVIEGQMVEPDYPAAFAALASRNRKRALTVLFTDVVDRTASDALVSHAGSLRPRHLPLAVTLRHPELERLATRRPATSVEAFERAAAEELLQARDAALADMRGRGVLVLDVPPAGAARAVVDQYTLLKRRAAI